MMIVLLWSIVKIVSIHQAPKFEIGDKVKVTKYKNFFNKGYTKNWWKEIFVIHYVFKSNPFTCKIKHLNWETIKGSFHENELLLRKL